MNHREIELSNDGVPIHPCTRTWDSLAAVESADRKRYCGECALQVHDLSAYSPRGARKLLGDTAGRVCVLKTLRRDGTLVTRRPLPRRLAPMLSAAASWLLVLIGGFLSSCPGTDTTTPAAGAAASPEPEGAPPQDDVLTEDDLEALTNLGGYVGMGYVE